MLGNLIPLLNPIRVAEEYAMIDVMSGGRLIAGMIRGVPHEYIAYNIVPDESRERLREAAALIVKCWTEPEPFGWEGEFYQYPSVSIWPRPLQQPHPPILMSASNEESAEFAGQHRAMMGMTLIADLAVAKRCIEVYRQAARAHGLDPTPEHILLGYNTCIADTDEEAREIMREGQRYFHRVLMHSIRDAQRLVIQKSRFFDRGARRAAYQPPHHAEGALDRRDDRGRLDLLRQPGERGAADAPRARCARQRALQHQHEDRQHSGRRGASRHGAVPRQGAARSEGSLMFTEHTIDLSSGPVHYQKGGSGPPLLHLHSSGGPRVSAVIERLAQRHSVFMPVAPGFNATPEHAAVKTISALADLMSEFAKTVDRREIRRDGRNPSAAGSRSGSRCAIPSWSSTWCSKARPDCATRAPAACRPTWKARMRALYSNPAHAPPETRSPQVLADTQRVRDGYVGGIAYDKALHDALPGIKARTLIVLGTRDTVVPVITAHRLKAGIANAHLSFIYGAAHALEFDAPARVAPLVAGFLERGEAFVVRSPAA